MGKKIIKQYVAKCFIFLPEHDYCNVQSLWKTKIGAHEISVNWFIRIRSQKRSYSLSFWILGIWVNFHAPRLILGNQSHHQFVLFYPMQTPMLSKTMVNLIWFFLFFLCYGCQAHKSRLIPWCYGVFFLEMVVRARVSHRCFRNRPMNVICTLRLRPWDPRTSNIFGFVSWHPCPKHFPLTKWHKQQNYNLVERKRVLIRAEESFNPSQMLHP